MRKIWSVITLIAFLSGSFPFIAQPSIAAGEEVVNLPQIEIPDKGNLKLDSPLNQLVLTETPEEAVRFARQSNIKLVDNSVRVIIECLPGEIGAATEAASALGVIETSYQDLLQVRVPVSQLEALADIPSVRFVRLPWQPQPAVISEGVGLIDADEWHTAGYTGAGVKIGILDGGFAGYAALLGTELPTSVTTQSFYAGSDIEGDSAHGTACAEIVYDVAPDANFYLVNFNTDVEMGNAVDWLISQGVDIISNSIGWPIYGPGDGSGPICEMVDAARAAGILWAVSIGNSAQHHWQGNFIDSDGDDFHEFSGSDESNAINAVSGDSITVGLKWDDPWGASSNDYDLYLFNDTDSYNPVAWSEGYQAGTQDPAELLGYTATYTGWYHIVIRSYASDETANFHLVSWYHDLEYQVASSSLAIPADSPNAMAVGAVFWDNPTAVEPFSSQGPTEDGRVKPDLVAPDGVTSNTYNPFYGTSASAPHAAAAAALVKEHYPSYGPAEIQVFLEDRAVDLGDTGKDNLFGSGRLDLGLPPVIFPDPNLEAAIREAIAKPSGDIYQSDLEVLTEFWAQDRNIADLAGLEYCINLVTLGLMVNQIIDIQLLASLTNLQSLNLSYNQITDIQPLANLANLQYLHLEHNQISNIQPLTNLINLLELELNDNQITDIQPLANLTNLQSLALFNNQISDTQPLANLTSLQYLHLGFNQMTDIQPLANLTSLQYLLLHANQISDIQPLANLTNLQDLVLYDNQISNIQPLANLTNLQDLVLYDNQISNIQPLVNLTSLQYLHLSHNQITDIQPVSDLTSLWYLGLDANQITDIQPIANLASLQILSLAINQISDIQPLANLASLKRLDLRINQISNIQPLANLTNLDCLELGENQITDIQSLANLAGLQILNLAINQITDISPLVQNQGLGAGDQINLIGNLLSTDSLNTYIPQLEGRGVTVLYDPNQPPNQPSNISPLDGEAGISTTPTLQSSSFSDPDPEPQTFSQWQVTTTPGDYTDPDFDSGEDDTNLTRIAIPPGTLDRYTTYYWRVRHKDNRGDWSAWSAEASFTTISPEAEIAVSQKQNASRIVMLPVSIAGLVDANTEGTISGTSIGSYQARIKYPDEIMMLEVLGGDQPFNSPAFEVYPEETVFEQSVTAGSEPPIIVARLVPRLIGCATEVYELGVGFLRIVNTEQTEIPQHEPLTLHFQRGDVDSNGTTDIIDAMKGAQHIVGIPTDINFLNMASVHYDGDRDVTNILDCLFIAQYLVGLRDCYFEEVP